MSPAELAAADYVASLWGKQRREFARRYWTFLACGMPRPALRSCFGAAFIVAKLESFAEVEKWWEPPHKQLEFLREDER